MSTATSGATADYSNGDGPPRRADRPAPRLAPARLGLALAGLGGAVALLASTPATVIRIDVAGSTDVPGYDTLLSGWDRHGAALPLLAVLGLGLLLLALRGARVAGIGLAVAGLVAVAIVLGVDAGELRTTGPIAEAYDNASAGPGLGFYFETAGAVGLLFAGGGLALLPRRRA